MADPNKLRITATAQGVEVLVSNENGQVKDISSKFRLNQGTTTPTSNSNSFTAQDNGTSINIEFVAVDKVLEYQLEPETAKQIYALAD